MTKFILFVLMGVLALILVPTVYTISYITLKERKRKWLREDDEFNRKKLAEAKMELEETFELIERM